MPRPMVSAREQELERFASAVEKALETLLVELRAAKAERKRAERARLSLVPNDETE